MKGLKVFSHLYIPRVCPTNVNPMESLVIAKISVLRMLYVRVYREGLEVALSFR